MYESCVFVFVMKGKQENRIGMMLGFSWTIQAKLSVQITRSKKNVYPQGGEGLKYNSDKDK